MNSKSIAILLLATLLISTLAAGPYCAMCEQMLANVRKQFNDDFSNVTADQLEAAMDAQCDAQSGAQATICKTIIQQDKSDLLGCLKAGNSDQECCTDGKLC